MTTSTQLHSAAPTVDAGAASVGDLLGRAGDATYRIGQDMWGFNGVHGGLAVALATSAMRRHVHGRQLRSVTGHLLRPITGDLAISSELLRQGRAATVTTATCLVDDTPALTVTAVFANSNTRTPVATVAPPAPPAPRPADCELVQIPLEFVPFAQHTEIRAVGTSRPFGGGSDAELTAWIRFIEDDEAPDELRLITMLDALAPSITAALDIPVIIPTVEYTVHPSPELSHASEPWLLIQARTSHSGHDGWLTEHISAWTPDGTHVGIAHQLRLIHTPRPPDPAR